MTNSTEDRRVTLHGRVIIQADIKAVTGLHIGGASGALEIGGVDSPVIRDPLTNRPYIPGSSLRGKMRSLSERVHGKLQNFPVGKGVYIHTCQSKGLTVPVYHAQFKVCPVCSVFGVTGDEPVPHPTSLIVRDVSLSDASAEALEKAQTDFPFTEIKWEATIDRVTSAATPRQIERVPAGSIFEGFELVYGIYDVSGRDHFKQVLKAMQLVEEDYLGGLGSRGGGKVEFTIKSVYARVGESYERVDFDLVDSGLTDSQAGEIADWTRSTFAHVTH